MVRVLSLLLSPRWSTPIGAIPLEASLSGSLSDWAVALMDTLGGPGAGLAIALENLFPPLPSEVILPLAGFAAARGSLSLVEALVWTTTGSVVGALLLYLIGATLGQHRVRALAARLPLVRATDVDRTQAWFDRHGGKAVFFGRMIPIFRSFISIPAGVHRMAVPKFALLTFAGSAVWNTLFVLAGFFLGDKWHVVERYAGAFQVLVLALAATAAAIFVVRRLRQHRADRASGAPTGP